MKKRKLLMEVAEECKAKNKHKPSKRELTRDETFEAIGGLKNELRWLNGEIVEIEDLLIPLKKRFEILANEKFRLEMSIHEVKIINIKPVKASKEELALQREIAELVDAFSPEELRSAKEKGLV